MDEQQIEDEGTPTKDGRAFSFFDIVSNLLTLHESSNICNQLPAETLTKLGRQVVRDTEEDECP
jgi:hypothetical protein